MQLIFGVVWRRRLMRHRNTLCVDSKQHGRWRGVLYRTSPCWETSELTISMCHLWLAIAAYRITGYRLGCYCLCILCSEAMVMPTGSNDEEVQVICQCTTSTIQEYLRNLSNTSFATGRCLRSPGNCSRRLIPSSWCSLPRPDN